MNRAAIVTLTPLSGLYGVAMKARRALYQRGLFHVHKAGAPVISVGNITTGGTGKTPLVEWIARALARRQNRVCILTRGYGREHPGNRVLVSNGSEILSDARAAGDEPLLLAEKLKGEAAVICDADRVAAARWATENLGSNLFILDDGFQHMRLARDYNIVAIDATNPWGNRRLLPAGNLRESPAQLARADCIVITRADDIAQTEALKSEIDQLSKGRPVFLSRMRINRLRRLSESKDDAAAEDPRSVPVAAFCGVGNPESFFAHLRRDGYQLCHTRVFPDHHYYTQEEINTLVSQSSERGAHAFLTTAKDEVKLRSLSCEMPGYVVDVVIEIEGESKFLALIDDAIGKAA
ncbi:MAG TPA: tetraacyldisaccharide 4'-kinase [Pyrinomonadaceae bacterium]|nr:tetraacyldisaccharide 4'-kinase [Pyrinomonadaceae bacterium]